MLARLQEGMPATSHPEEGAQHQISNLIPGREASKDLVGRCWKLQRPSAAQVAPCASKLSALACVLPA